MRVAVKVLEVGGKQWFVNTGFARPESPKLLTVICSGEEGKTLTMVMSVDEFNDLEYHWFQDMGPAEHQPDQEPEFILVGRAPK